jgi:hypothetical protein
MDLEGSIIHNGGGGIEVKAETVSGHLYGSKEYPLVNRLFEFLDLEVGKDGRNASVGRENYSVTGKR